MVPNYRNNIEIIKREPVQRILGRSKSSVKRRWKKKLYETIDKIYERNKKKKKKLDTLKKQNSLKGKKAVLFFQFLKPNYAYAVTKKLKWNRGEVSGYIKKMIEDNHLTKCGIRLGRNFREKTYFQCNLKEHLKYFCQKNGYIHLEENILNYIISKYPEIIPNFNSKKYKNTFDFMESVLTDLIKPRKSIKYDKWFIEAKKIFEIDKGLESGLNFFNKLRRGEINWIKCKEFISRLEKKYQDPLIIFSYLTYLFWNDTLNLQLTYFLDN